MAPEELYSGSFKGIPVTKISTLRLVCFSVLIFIFSQCENSSAFGLNKTGARVRLKPDRKFIEIHKRLRAINKPAVKTIQSPDGDIIDCILRHRQIAFDDPLLKNHTIQEFPTIPSGIPMSSMGNRTSKRPLQTWHLTGARCPKGTIPVRRTSAEDLMRYESHRLYDQRKFDDLLLISRKPDNQVPLPPFRREYATVRLVNGQFYGTAMIADVWNPKLATAGDLSISQTWIIAGDATERERNTIEAGWLVHPPLYGDTRSRFFIYWTRDNYNNTGCYNLQCSGFVQTSEQVVLGVAFSTVSIYNSVQFEISLFIWKDPDTGHWWLYLQNYGKIGYFPSNIFTHLENHAERIEWGGEVGYYTKNGHHTEIEMGSGHYADEGFRRASYIRNLRIVNDSHLLADVESPIQLVTAFYCYSLDIGDNAEWGIHIFFGGPGHGRGCP